MLKIGENLVDGRTVVITVDESGNVRLEFPSWRSPVDDKAFAVTYSPGTTMAFVETQVAAIVRGEIPPFI